MDLDLGPWCLVHRRLGSCTTPAVLPGWDLRYPTSTSWAPSTWCWRAILTTSWVSRGNSFNSKQLDQIVFLPVFVLFFNHVWVRLALFSYQAVVDLYIGKGWSSDHVAMQLSTLRLVKLWNTFALKLELKFDMAGFTSLTTFISRWHDKHLASIPAVCVMWIQS